jgi:putative ABC transport system permease protein
VSTLGAALWLFRGVIVPSWRRHRLRTALTLVGVTIGVQVVVAVRIVNRSTVASFAHTVEAIAGGADLQITNGTAGVPEDLILEVAALPGVESAAGLVQGTLRTPEGPLTLFGADLLGDQRIRQIQFPRDHVRIPDELRFLNAPDSVALSTSFAAQAGLDLGARIHAIAPTGPVTVTVRGFLDPVGPAALFGGAVALADLPAAQEILGLGNRVDQIDVKLAGGAEVERVQAEIAVLAAGVGSVGPPRERAARLGSMLASVQTVLALLGFFAIIVGAFIIYHTMQTAIVQRRRDLALSRAVGFSSATAAAAIALEALALGAVGALAGLALAVAAAQLSLNVVTSGIAAIWARIDHPELMVALRDVALAGELGIGVSLAAAAAASRDVLRLRVLDHLRDLPDDSPPVPARRAALAGVALAGLGFALGYADLRPEVASGKIAYIMASVVLVAFGYVLLAPAVAQPILRALARVAKRARGLTLALATEHLARDAHRTQGAAAALMVAFAMVLIAGAFIASLRESLVTWVDQTLAPDLAVQASAQLPLPASPTLPAGVAELIREIPGVADVSPSRAINVRVGGTLAVLRSESSSAVRRHAYPVVESAGSEWLDRFGTGAAVVISDNLAYRQRLRAGDTLALDTPTGRASFEIGAVVIDYTLDVGTILVESGAYRRLWQDDLANSVAVWVAPGADPVAIRARIAERVSPRMPLTIMTSGELKRSVGAALDGALVMTYAIQLLAIAIALIGVVNLFLAEVERRRREIGLLRGVALDGHEIRRTLALEALILGGLGGVMAVLYAWPVSLMLVTRSTRLISGWSLSFTFPYALAAATVAVAALTSMAAAVYPARRATAVPVARLVSVE